MNTFLTMLFDHNLPLFSSGSGYLHLEFTQYSSSVSRSASPTSWRIWIAKNEDRFICLYAHSEIDVIDGRVCFNKLAAVCWVHCVSCLRFLWGALDKQQIRTYWLGEWRIMSVAMICKVFRTSWCSSYALPINMLRLLENIVKNYLRDLAIRISDDIHMLINSFYIRSQKLLSIIFIQAANELLAI